MTEICTFADVRFIWMRALIEEKNSLVKFKKKKYKEINQSRNMF